MRRAFASAAASTAALLFATLIANCTPHLQPPPTPEERACSIWCNGPILAAVQEGNIFPDSKTFVDMPLKPGVSPEAALGSFAKLARHHGQGRKPIPTSKLRAWVAATFEDAGSDVVPWMPPDWVADPPLIAQIGNATVKNWTRGLNGLWKVLGRKPAPSVSAHPEQHTLLPVQHGLVVPGGRFRESYYWDSFWIIKGLLATGMVETAKGVVDNLLDFVVRYGRVPNGGRVYYLDRSQPPMLSEMVRTVHAALNATNPAAAAAWLKTATPTVALELQFWDAQRRAAPAPAPAPLPGFGSAANLLYNLSRYGNGANDGGSDADGLPRPESWREDVATAARAKPDRPSAAIIYRELVAGAESGWDFSSRWFEDGFNLTTINTTAVVPVELNCILIRAELNLHFLHTVLGNVTGAAAAAAAARSRHAAVERLMWNESLGRWVDLTVGTGKQRLRRGLPASASDFLPLWANSPTADVYNVLTRNNTRQAAAAAALEKTSGLVGVAGVRTTKVSSGQQWDNPNSWAPVVDMLIEGLSNVPTEQAASLGRIISERWLETMLVAWQRTGYMYEKYDADQIGAGGGGGEYTPQIGFGWSNGVALSLIERMWASS